MPRVAMCPRCKPAVPLVSTLAFSKAEFYCLDCGGRFGWLEPDSADESTELLADCDVRAAEFRPVDKALLVTGSRLTGCEKCAADWQSTHPEHATVEECAADAAARQWLLERVRTK